MRLSDQAIAALMVTLQKGILEQTDITELIRAYNFQIDEKTESLLITNPPTSIAGPTVEGSDKNFTVGSD